MDRLLFCPTIALTRDKSRTINPTKNKPVRFTLLRTIKPLKRKIKRRLEKINFPENRVKIVAGFIEETINYKNLPSTVSFAYVDFDFYEPIKIALNFLDTVLSKNGLVIVDDYDFFSTGVKAAVDEFILKETGKYQLYIPETGLGHFAVIKKL